MTNGDVIDGCVKVWDFHTGDFLFNYYESEEKINRLQISDDGAFLVITLDTKVVILNLETKEEFLIEKSCQNLNYPLMSAISKEELFLHSANNGLEQYELKSGLLKKSFMKSVYHHRNLEKIFLGCGEEDFFSKPVLTISSDSRYLAMVGNYQQIIVWDMERLSLVNICAENREAIGKLVISPNNQYLISVSTSYFSDEELKSIEINLYELESGLLVYSFELPSSYGQIVAMGITDDNRYLKAVFTKGAMITWDIEELLLVKEKPIGCSYEYLKVFSPMMSSDASLFIYGLAKDFSNGWEEKYQFYTINIIDTNSLKTVDKIYYDGFIIKDFYNYNIAISNDNRYVDFYTENHHVFSWDRVDKSFLYETSKKEFEELGIYSSAIAPNKQYKANIFMDKQKEGVVIFDFEKKRDVYQLITAENGNQVIIDLLENTITVEGEDEVLLEVTDRKNFKDYERLDLSKKE